MAEAGFALKPLAIAFLSVIGCALSGDLHCRDHALEFIDPVAFHQPRHGIVRVVQQRLRHGADHLLILPVDGVHQRRPGQGGAQLRQQTSELDQRLGKD